MLVQPIFKGFRNSRTEIGRYAYGLIPSTCNFKIKFSFPTIGTFQFLIEFNTVFKDLKTN
tara:strand:+ start:20 stop:199 length:180 start_codon:yes stop_codon:yes gene_type:complete